MRRSIIGAALILAVFSSAQALACDCTISKNWSNPQCKGKTPKLPNGTRVAPPTTVLLQPSSTATAGAGATSTSTGTQSQGQSQTNGNNTNTAAGGSASTGASTSSARGGAGGAGGSAQGGAGGSAAASANTDGNATASTTGNQTSEVSNYAAARNPVATAVAGFQVTTASCRFAEGVGIQTLPAGTSVGLTFKDHDCIRAELAQMLYSRGARAAGDKLMCEIKEVHDALGKDCLTTIALVEVPVTAAPDAVTHSELQEVERRIVQRTTGK